MYDIFFQVSIVVIYNSLPLLIFIANIYVDELSSFLFGTFYVVEFYYKQQL